MNGKRPLFLMGACDVIQDGRQGSRHLRCDSKFEFIEKVLKLHFFMVRMSSKIHSCYMLAFFPEKSRKAAFLLKYCLMQLIASFTAHLSMDFHQMFPKCVQGRSKQLLKTSRAGLHQKRNSRHSGRLSANFPQSFSI